MIEILHTAQNIKHHRVQAPVLYEQRFNRSAELHQCHAAGHLSQTKPALLAVVHQRAVTTPQFITPYFADRLVLRTVQSLIASLFKVLFLRALVRYLIFSFNQNTISDGHNIDYGGVVLQKSWQQAIPHHGRFGVFAEGQRT